MKSKKKQSQPTPRLKSEKVSFAWYPSAIYNEVSLPAPTVDEVCECVDLGEQTANDGLSLEGITRHIQTWTRVNAETVDRVAFGYAAGKYFLSVLLAGFSEKLVVETYARRNELTKLFKPHEPMIYVLGPNQTDSLLLSPAIAKIIEGKLTK